MTHSNRQAPARPAPIVLPVGPPTGRGRETLPAFPEIRAAYRGFCIPHVQCGGLREDAEPHERILVGLHELLHWQLADALLPRALRVEMVKIWQGIVDCAAGKYGQDLPVPLDPTHLDGELAQAIPAVAELASAMETMQEVFAISVSFHLLEKAGVLSAAEVMIQRSDYIRIYRRLPGFRSLYPRFEGILKRYGYEVAKETAKGSLETPSPTSTCELAIDHVNRFGPETPLIITVDDPGFPEWRVGVRQAALDYHNARTPGPEEFYDTWFMHAYFSDFPLTPFIFRVFEEGWLIGADVEIPEIAHLAGLCEFLPENPPMVFPWADAVYTWLFYESLRQQLMTGVGLQCPFWYSDWNYREPRRCCAIEDDEPHRRAILEGLLAHTHGPKSWCPRGCLLR